MFKVGFILFLLLAYISSSCHATKSTAVRGSDTEMFCFETSHKNTEGRFVKVKFGGQVIAWITMPKFEIKFKVDEPKASQFMNRLQPLPTGDLLLKNPQTKDEGLYECTVEGVGLSEEGTQTQLVDFVPPEVEVRKTSETLQADSGEQTAAVCKALNGKPQPVVEWTTDRHLEFQAKKTEPDGNVMSELMVEPTKYYHKQRFVCTINHESFAVPMVREIVLEVTYKPGSPKVQTSSNTLTCSADANPPAAVTWLLPDGTQSDAASVQMIEPENPLRYNDTYKCMAKNALGASERSIKVSEAMSKTVAINQSSSGLIAGAIIGVVVLLALIMGIVYFFLLKPSRTKNPGPYIPPYSKDSTHAMINRPPSPMNPPPALNKYEMDDDASSDVESSFSDEGQHDVDIDVNPYTTIVDPAKSTTGGGEDIPLKQGITSRASLNFQARRQRPGTSPSYRNSRHSAEGGLNPQRPVSRVGDQPQQPFSYMVPPKRANDQLPPYEGNYTEIDHTSYRPGPVRRNEDPVEYAQIRKYPDSHVV